MKRPTMLLNRVLINLGLQVGVAVERDSQEIESRFEHEGMSFLTITLPSLCDTLDQGLARGRIAPSDFHGFKTISRGGSLPALLSGFFMRVFESDGALKDCPCIPSIRAIRQVTRLFKKVELPCSPARVLRAFERYKSNDASVLSTVDTPALYCRVSSILWSDLQRLSGALYCAPGIFGTGATAERKSRNARLSVQQWPIRSELSFPSDYHGTGLGSDLGSLSGIQYLSEDEELPVRVVQVPKTLKTPRIISVEPSYMMLMQQSVARILMAYLESDQFPYKSIRFTNQMVNRECARVGSSDGSLATIDLKDASDMVSNDLVLKTFSCAPDFVHYIQDCRSTKAQLPDKSVVQLRKFASQGSALCFPIEAMVFYTIIIYSILRQTGQRPSAKVIAEISAKVSVYGDDIVVPSQTAPGVMEDLEAFGLKVNHDKSFWTGNFRESCGGDYYKGEDVTPSYVRHYDFSGNTRSARFVSANVSLSNQFYMKGLWHVSQYLRDELRLSGCRISRTRREVACLTFASILFDTGLRYDRQLHCWRVRGPAIRVGRKPDPTVDIRGVLLYAFGSSEHRDYVRRAVSVNLLDDVQTAPWHGHALDGLQKEWDLQRIVYNASHARHTDEFVGDVLASGCVSNHVARPSGGVDTGTSVDSYSSNVKNRWAAVYVSTTASSSAYYL